MLNRVGTGRIPPELLLEISTCIITLGVNRLRLTFLRWSAADERLHSAFPGYGPHQGHIILQHFHARPRRKFLGHLHNTLAEYSFEVEFIPRRRSHGVWSNPRTNALLVQNTERLHTLRLSVPALRLQLPRCYARDERPAHTARAPRSKARNHVYFRGRSAAAYSGVS